MKLYQYLNFKPQLGKEVFLAPGSIVIGRAFLGDHSNIWFNTVIRADVAEIRIGENTNIQDLCVLHVVEECPLWIGKNVTVGHNVILHACKIEDSCLIGMGSTILDGAVIGEGSLVASGSVVPPGKVFPPNSFILGSPAKVIRALRPDEKQTYQNHYQTYVKYKNQYLNSNEFVQLK